MLGSFLPEQRIRKKDKPPISAPCFGGDGGRSFFRGSDSASGVRPGAGFALAVAQMQALIKTSRSGQQRGSRSACSAQLSA